MKKLYAVIATVALGLSLGATAMAHKKTAGKTAKKAGCSSCDKKCATPEQLKKFKANSIDLHQEMMNKRFDLQREELKEAPDSAKVAAIKADLEAIKTKIDTLKTAAKLPKSACCCLEDCPLMEGNCDKCKSCAKGKCGDCGKGKAGAKTAKAAKSAKHCANCDKKEKAVDK